MCNNKTRQKWQTWNEEFQSFLGFLLLFKLMVVLFCFVFRFCLYFFFLILLVFEYRWIAAQLGVQKRGERKKSEIKRKSSKACKQSQKDRRINRGWAEKPITIFLHTIINFVYFDGGGSTNSHTLNNTTSMRIYSIWFRCFHSRFFLYFALFSSKTYTSQ